jgi:hypothetical protein
MFLRTSNTTLICTDARHKECQQQARQLAARDTMANKVDSYHTVVVIGAGAAGLYAAQQLRQQYPDVLVVEAQNHVGGRIRQVGRRRLEPNVLCMSTTRGGPCRDCHADAAFPAAGLAGSLCMCCTHQE